MLAGSLFLYGWGCFLLVAVIIGAVVEPLKDWRRHRLYGKRLKILKAQGWGRRR